MDFQSIKMRALPATLIAISSFFGIAADDAEASHGHNWGHHRGFHGGNHSRAIFGGRGFGYGLPYGARYLPAVVIGGGYPHHHREAYRAHNGVSQANAPANTTSKIFAYPANGQSREQQAKDKFECYSWAVNESGFDPVALATAGGASATPVSHTVRPNNPGPSDPITGAAGGAALGALGGAIAGDAGLGAAIGAAVGGGVGLANHVDETSREKTVTQYPAAQQTGPVGDYRRAMTACLDARGYTVK